MSEIIKPSAFAAEFIDELTEAFDWPITLNESSSAGPWNVEPHGMQPDGHEKWVVRHQAGGPPYATTRFRETALMIAATLPASGREPIYSYQYQPDGELRMSLGDAGFEHVAIAPEMEKSALLALHVAHSLLVSPAELALLLLAAPSDTLERAGALATKWLDHMRTEHRRAQRSN